MNEGPPVTAEVGDGIAPRRSVPVGVSMLLGIAVRLAWLPLGNGTARFSNPDSSSYVEVAERMPSVLWDPGQVLGPSLQRTPGYPAFLWLVSLGGHVDPVVVVVVQCLIGGGVSVGLCWVLTRQCFGVAAAGWAALLLALDPVSIGHSLQVGTETVFTALLLVTALLLDRLRTAAATRDAVVLAASAGAVVAAAALTRPLMLYFAPLAAIALAASRARAARRMTTVAAGRAALLLPPIALMVVAALVTGSWFARNAGVADRWLFSTAQGQNLFDYGAAAAAAEAGGGPGLDPVSPPERAAELDAAGRRLLAQHPEVADADMSDPVVQNDVWTRIGLDALADHPRGYLVVSGQAVIRTMFGPGQTQLETVSPGLRGRGVAVTIAAAGVLAVQYVAAALGAVAAWRRRRGEVLLLVGLLSYVVLVAAGPQEYARFRVPVVPLICALAGYGIAVAGARASRRRWT